MPVWQRAPQEAPADCFDQRGALFACTRKPRRIPDPKQRAPDKLSDQILAQSSQKSPLPTRDKQLPLEQSLLTDTIPSDAHVPRDILQLFLALAVGGLILSIVVLVDRPRRAVRILARSTTSTPSTTLARPGPQNQGRRCRARLPLMGALQISLLC